MTMKLRFADEELLEQKEKKARLRAYMKNKRMENTNRDVKEERLIANFYKAIFGETPYPGTRLNFFIYLSFFREAPTDGLIERLISDGHKVYCPRIENGGMTAVEYGSDFTLSDYGIREPIGEVYQGDIDVAVIPFLAVDRQGNRLGYGGGYYDRFLKTSTAKRVAYGYSFQVVNEVPTDDWDEKVSVIVTDEKIIQI
jgi:5-formyltetrahydrofolate cyclo-ligase